MGLRQARRLGELGRLSHPLFSRFTQTAQGREVLIHQALHQLSGLVDPGHQRLLRWRQGLHLQGCTEQAQGIEWLTQRVVLKAQGLIVGLGKTDALPAKLSHGAHAARTRHPAAPGTCG